MKSFLRQSQVIQKPDDGAVRQTWQYVGAGRTSQWLASQTINQIITNHPLGCWRRKLFHSLLLPRLLVLRGSGQQKPAKNSSPYRPIPEPVLVPKANVLHFLGKKRLQASATVSCGSLVFVRLMHVRSLRMPFALSLFIHVESKQQDKSFLPKVKEKVTKIIKSIIRDQRAQTQF